MNFTSLQTMLLNLALTLLLGGFVVADAQPPWARGGQNFMGPGGPGGGNLEEHFARVLNLTDAQKTQIKALREQAATASQPYVEQLKPLAEQSRALIETPTFDEAAARALATRMLQLQTELHLIRAKTEAAIYNLLTPEQKAKLAELRKAMEENQDGPPQGGGRRGGGGRPGN